jgi:hypothetical protein
MPTHHERFLLGIPAGYFEMSEDAQKAAAMAIWREAMAQMGEDPNKLISENAKDECPDEPGS